jgi:hypothetical protein
METRAGVVAGVAFPPFPLVWLLARQSVWADSQERHRRVGCPRGVLALLPSEKQRRGRRWGMTWHSHLAAAQGERRVACSRGDSEGRLGRPAGLGLAVQARE